MKLTIFKNPTISWIKREIEFIRDRLFDCVIGQLRSRGQIAGFPRVVRFPEDNRGFSLSDAEYRSIIAKFLMDFSNHYLQGNLYFLLPGKQKRTLKYFDFFKTMNIYKNKLNLAYIKTMIR